MLGIGHLVRWINSEITQSGEKPSQETKIKISYNDNNLYVGFKCFDKGPVYYFLWLEIENKLL